MPVANASEFAVGDDEDNASEEHSNQGVSPLEGMDDRHVWSESRDT